MNDRALVWAAGLTMDKSRNHGRHALRSVNTNHGNVYLGRHKYPYEKYSDIFLRMLGKSWMM
jgi:hypothetical protein